MRRATLRSVVGAVALATVVTACSGGGSGGTAQSTPSTSAGVDIVATALSDATAAQLQAATVVLKKRFAELGVNASIAANPPAHQLHVTVNKADVDAAKFALTERGLLDLSRVFEARQKSAQTCRPKANTFGKKAVAAGGAVECDPADGLVLLLGPIEISQADISNAVAKTVSGVQGWEVALTLKHEADASWVSLTRSAYAATGSVNPGFGTCKPPGGCNAIAFVIDGGLVELPSIPRAGGLPASTAAISGDFDEDLAKRLAATLNSGPLPVAFSIPAS